MSITKESLEKLRENISAGSGYSLTPRETMLGFNTLSGPLLKACECLEWYALEHNKASETLAEIKRELGIE